MLWVQERAFGNNYSRPIVGYERDIERLTRLDISNFFHQHYGPDALSRGCGW